MNPKQLERLYGKKGIQMFDPSNHDNTSVGASHSRPVRYGKWLVRVLAAGLAVWLTLEYDLLNPVYEWFRSDFELWLNNHSVLAPLVYILVYILSVVALIPGSMLTLIGGGIFGPLWGSIYVSMPSTVAAGVAFLIARYLAADWAGRKKSGKFTKLKRGIEAEGWLFLAFARLVPIVCLQRFPDLVTCKGDLCGERAPSQQRTWEDKTYESLAGGLLRKPERICLLTRKTRSLFSTP